MTDLYFAFRQLLKKPGFTVVAVLTLALGIGINTSIFSAFQELLARQLPYPEPGQLVQIFQTSAHSQHEPHHSPANFLDYRAQAADFEFMAALNDRQFNLAQSGQLADQVRGMQVSADFFPLLAIQPELGRMFAPEEDSQGRNQVVILDHGFWVRRFAGDTNIIGRVLRIDGEPVTVIGVMPARFNDIMLSGPVSFWRPIAFSAHERLDRSVDYLKCIGRLKAGVSISHAQAAMNVLAARLAHEHPHNSPERLRLVPLAESSLPPEARKIVWAIMVLAGFVLLIACANLANLSLARASERSRELAIRAALGAPRLRLLRQLITESLLLALLGGLLGLVLAKWGNDLLHRQLVFEGETVLALPLSLRVLGFAFAASAGSTLVFGLLPAWAASRTDVNEALKKGSRGTTGQLSQPLLQHSLIVAEVSLALMLLGGAGLVVSGLRGFAALNPGWQPDKLTLGFLTLSEKKYSTDGARRAFVERLQERLGALPGVERVAVGWTLPVWQFDVTANFTIDPRLDPLKGPAPVCYVNAVTPGYFQTLGMRLQAGRDFDSFDTTNGPPVVIINESMARAFWQNESPIGSHIDGNQVVGVVNDVRFPANPSERRTSFQTYRPLSQFPRDSLVVALRGNIPQQILRHAVAELDPDQPVGEPGPANALIVKSLHAWAIGGRLLASFSVLGLFLAALGIYGVISGFVVRRTAEIGMRMALGARISHILWLVVCQGMRLSLVGTAIGLLGAFGLTRLLSSLMPEFPHSSPLVIVFVAVFLLAVALFASWLPARRAARVDPLVALRAE